LTSCWTMAAGALRRPRRGLLIGTGAIVAAASPAQAVPPNEDCWTEAWHTQDAGNYITGHRRRICLYQYDLPLLVTVSDFDPRGLQNGRHQFRYRYLPLQRIGLQPVPDYGDCGLRDPLRLGATAGWHPLTDIDRNC